MVAVQQAYWRACREHYCWHLDDTVRLPECMESIVHETMSESMDPKMMTSQPNNAVEGWQNRCTHQSTNPERHSVEPWEPLWKSKLASENFPKYVSSSELDDCKTLPVITGIKETDKWNFSIWRAFLATVQQFCTSKHIIVLNSLYISTYHNFVPHYLFLPTCVTRL